MRILLVTLGTFFVSFLCFWIVKLWGQSQTYTDYKHPMYADQPEVIEFTKPFGANFEDDLKNKKNLYLDVAITQDQKLVALKKNRSVKDKPIRYSNADEILATAVLLQDYKQILKEKKIIFNIVENAQAVHENFFYNMQQLELQKGDNVIVTSPYEAPVKALKDLAPSFLFGTTQPEILKIVAMGSMHLFEAVNIRADLIIHPLKIKNQSFFNEELLNEIKRRHKRFIIGPIAPSEKEKAAELKPYGLVIDTSLQ